LFYRGTFLLVYIAQEPYCLGDTYKSCFKHCPGGRIIYITYGQRTWAKLSSYFQLFPTSGNKNSRPCIRPGAIGKSAIVSSMLACQLVHLKKSQPIQAHALGQVESKSPILFIACLPIRTLGRQNSH
jgi:hypothetical protein